MLQQLFTNNAASTLASAITNTATTVNLAAGEGSKFPTPTGGDFFLLTIFEKNGSGSEIKIEIVKCTARTSDALTISRNYEATGAFAYDPATAYGGVVYAELRWTASAAQGLARLAADNPFTGGNTFAGATQFNNTFWVNQAVSYFYAATAAGPSEVRAISDQWSAGQAAYTYIKNDGTVAKIGSSHYGATTTKPLVFDVDGEAMRIDTSQRVGIGVTPTARNNTTLQIKDGIGFPATQVASSDANTLDDYEEGTFNVSVGGSATYSNTACRYTKIGNRVFFEGRLTITTIGTGSTTVISGLPFSAGGTSSFHVGYWAGLAVNCTYVGGYISGTTMSLQAKSFTAFNGIDTTAILGNGTDLIFSGHYTV